MGSELEVTKQRMEQLQQQTTQMMRDRSAVNAELNALKDQLAAKDEALKAAQAGQSEMLSKMQKEFSSLSMQASGEGDTEGGTILTGGALAVSIC